DLADGATACALTADAAWAAAAGQEFGESLRPYIFCKHLRALWLRGSARHLPLIARSMGGWPLTPAARHETETLLANSLHEIKRATALVEQRDAATRSRLSALESSVNDLMRKHGRPSGGNGRGDTDERAQAIGLLEQKYYHVQTKHDPSLPEPPSFSEDQIN